MSKGYYRDLLNELKIKCPVFVNTIIKTKDNEGVLKISVDDFTDQELFYKAMIYACDMGITVLLIPNKEFHAISYKGENEQR